MSEAKLVYPSDYPRYTRVELLKLCRKGVRYPNGMPPFKQWFGDLPPQTTSPLTSKRSPRPPNASISSSSYATNPESSGRARTGNRRATSPGGTFTRDRAPHAREGGADRERGGASSDFKNPFSASASGPGGMRMGNFTHRAGRNGEDGETLGLKKLADSYDRTKSNAVDLNGSSSRNGESGRRTGALTGLDGVVRGGRGDRERERDSPRTDRTTPRKDGEIEGRAERSERMEKERADRKAERSEDWRRGASQLPSRPPPTTSSSSSSLPSGAATPNGLSSTPSRVPGRPAWNPAPTTDSPSRSNTRDRDDRRHDGHHRRDRGDDDDGSMPAWAAEESTTPATSKLGGFGPGGEKEDEIQRFKREMKERDLRANGGGRRAEEKRESAPVPPVSSADFPSSLSIGGIQIPVHANSPVVAPTRPNMPSSTASSTSIQSVLLPQPAGPPTPVTDDAVPSGGRRGGSRFAKFFADGKPKEVASPVTSPAAPSDGGNLGALLGGMALGGGGGQAGGAPGDNQMSKLLAMLQSSKPGDAPRASPLQQHPSFIQSPAMQSPAPAPLAPAQNLAAPSPNVRHHSHSASIPSDAQQQQQQLYNQLRSSPAPHTLHPGSPLPPPSQHQQPPHHQPSPSQPFNSPLYPHPQQHHAMSPPSSYAPSPSSSAQHLLHTLGGPQPLPHSHMAQPPRSYLSPPPPQQQAQQDPRQPSPKSSDPYEQAQRLQQIIEAQHQQRGGAPIPPGMGGVRQPPPPPPPQQYGAQGQGQGQAGMDMLRGMMQQQQQRGAPAYGGPTGPRGGGGGYEQTYGGGAYGGPQQGDQQTLLQQQQQQRQMQQQMMYGQYAGGGGGQGGQGGGALPPGDLMSLLMHGQGGGGGGR